MIKQNLQLEEKGFSIRCVSYSQKYVELSNGVMLDGKNKVERFFRRLAAGWNVDLAYNISESIRDEYISEYKSSLARVGGINCQKQNPHIKEIAKENLRQVRLAGKNTEKMRSGEISIWNKGLTKETDYRLQKVSKQRTGEGNPMFGHQHTDEYKKNASVTMKENIKSGKFTPNVKNSRTHWQVIYSGKRFRSSWEAAWFALNRHYEYETKRISYWLNGIERIYIVDFYDPITNTLVEVKPAEHTYGEVFEAKKSWAEKWAEENNGKYIVVTQQYLKDNMDQLLLSDLPDEVKIKIQGIK